MNLYIKNAVLFLSILFASCSNASDQVKLKFGDEVYDALKVWEFLNEVYSVDEVDRIYTWSVGVDQIYYELYINKNLDNPQIKQNFKKVI